MAITNKDISLIFKAIDNTQGAIRNLKSGLTGLKGSVSNLTVAFTALASAFVVKDVLRAGMAMERIENTFIAIAGSAEGAAREIDFVRQVANKLGLEFEIAIENYSKFSAAAIGTSIAGEKTRQIFEKVSEATVALGLDAERTKSVFIALWQIMSKGKVQAEEMRRQMGNQIPGALQIAARSMNKTAEEFSELMKQGKIGALEFLPDFAKEMSRTFEKALPRAIKSAIANVNRFKNSIFDLKVAFAASGFMRGLIGVLNEVTTTLQDPGLNAALESISENFLVLDKNSEVLSKGLAVLTWVIERLSIGISYITLSLVNIGTAIGGVGAAVRITTKDIISMESSLKTLILPSEGTSGIIRGLLNRIFGSDKPGDATSILKQTWKDILKQTDEGYQRIVDLVDKFKADKDKKITLPSIIIPSKEDKVVEDTKMAAQQAKLALVKVQEAVKTELANLESLYDRGLKTVKQYIEDRQIIIRVAYDAEINAINKLILAEKDEIKQIQLQAKLIRIEEKYKRNIIALYNQEIEAIKQLKDAREDLRQSVEDVQFRAIQATTPKYDFLAQQDAELTALEHRQNREITNLENLTVKKEQEAEKQMAIKDTQIAHEMEKNALLAEQERALNEYKLQMAATAASDLSDIFNNMHIAFGEHTKAFFILEKAAAIAKAIISTNLAVAKALEQGGAIFGISMATIVRAKGMATVAAIAAQTIQGLAGGGKVIGSSPNKVADNIPIMATADEYMQPVSSVKYYGLGIMEALRKRVIPKELFSSFNLPKNIMQPLTGFATGGLVTEISSNKNFSVSVPVNITGVSNTDQISGKLQQGIEDTVINILKTELA